MPLFRHIHRNPGDDSTYLFDANPDEERFESVPEKKSSKKDAAEAAEAKDNA